MLPEQIRVSDLLSWLITAISVTSTLVMLVHTFRDDSEEQQSKKRAEALRDQKVDNKLDSIGSNVESLLKKVENFGNRITVLETKYEQLAKDVSRLQEHCDSMFRNIGGTD